MDKQLSFIIIGFLSLFSYLITRTIVGVANKNGTNKRWAIGYTALVWSCIVALLIITIIY